MTDNQLVAGMASETVFFDVLVPLRDFINEATDQQVAFNKVIDFLKSASQEATSIEELAELVKNFGNN
ncbi:MAG: hypothetical protein ABII10_02490 [Candidatus Paceibacterota bacterium]